MNRKQRKKIAKKRAKQNRTQERNPGVRVLNRHRIIPTKHSRRAEIAFGMALAMIFVYAGLIAAAFRSEGGLSTYYGSAGLLAMVISFAALIMALLSRKERDSFKLFPNLALFFSLVACLLWFGTYLMGMA